jgi:hypothetical protein
MQESEKLMADTEEKPSDPVTQEPLKNKGTVDVEAIKAEAEAAKRRAEQAEMRARQLENEKAKKQQEEESARQKQLEEQQEFKTLYERERVERERLQRESDEAEQRKTVATAQTDITKEYPKEVLEVAESAGLKLQADSEEAKKDFKERLDAIKAKVAPGKTVGANNPNISKNNITDQENRISNNNSIGRELVADAEGIKPNPFAAKRTFKDVLNNNDGFKRFKQTAGVKVD